MVSKSADSCFFRWQSGKKERTSGWSVSIESPDRIRSSCSSNLPNPVRTIPSGKENGLENATDVKADGKKTEKKTKSFCWEFKDRQLEKILLSEGFTFSFLRSFNFSFLFFSPFHSLLLPLLFFRRLCRHSSVLMNKLT